MPAGGQNLSYQITFGTQQPIQAVKQMESNLQAMAKSTASSLKQIYDSALGPFAQSPTQMASRFMAPYGKSNDLLEGAIWQSGLGSFGLGGMAGQARRIQGNATADATAVERTLEIAQAYGAHGAKLPREAIIGTFDAIDASERAGMNARRQAQDIILQHQKFSNNKQIGSMVGGYLPSSGDFVRAQAHAEMLWGRISEFLQRW